MVATAPAVDAVERKTIAELNFIVMMPIERMSSRICAFVDCNVVASVHRADPNINCASKENFCESFAKDTGSAMIQRYQIRCSSMNLVAAEDSLNLRADKARVT